MNNINLKRNGKSTVQAAGMALLCLLALVTSSTRADSGCANARGDAELTAAPGGFFQGPAWIFIGETLFYPQILVLGTGSKVTEDGTIVGTTRITYDFGGGDVFVTGNNHFALDPTGPGVFHLTDHGRITEGTGSFADVSGRLMLQGVVSFSPAGEGNAALTIKGRVCSIGN